MRFLYFVRHSIKKNIGHKYLVRLKFYANTFVDEFDYHYRYKHQIGAALTVKEFDCAKKITFKSRYWVKSQYLRADILFMIESRSFSHSLKLLIMKNLGNHEYCFCLTL